MVKNLIVELIFFNTVILNITAVSALVRSLIKKDSIIIYATKALSERITFTKEGDVIESGLILIHKSGKWIIGKSLQDKNAKQIGAEGPPIIDFKKKQFWTF